MELRQLRQFVAVAEELHFGRAAERLNMTQPPLSQSIQLLEKELGLLLFERTKRHVKLTSLGEQWLVHARRVLDEATALPATARKLARGEMGLLRLSFVSTVDYSLLPAIVSRFRAAYPQVELSLREATSDVQIDALLRGEVDAGFVIAPPSTSLSQTLTYCPILREPLVAAVPSLWIDSRRTGFGGETLDPHDFFAAPLILFPRRSAPIFHDLVSGYFAAHGAAFAVFQEAIQMQTIIGLVAAGMGVALVPQSMTRLQREGVTYLALSGRVPTVETGLIWRSNDGNAALQNFRSIANTFASSAQ
ncbi:MAG TPA: LysR substrate-binding domain-containing protein [Ensifer sp.]|jgi:DNA-binding transcriptional LysR family regulator|uniref:LysR substrate-binding domain-containing protein n=1 Tax=Ensifer sp. TaxID=1872086 RepID=UPI002E11D94B|nr:LysR substrate-binding domain-containing protein [Ensifer sp.]